MVYFDVDNGIEHRTPGSGSVDENSPLPSSVPHGFLTLLFNGETKLDRQTLVETVMSKKCNWIFDELAIRKKMKAIIEYFVEVSETQTNYTT